MDFDKHRRLTHTHVIGGTRVGKSKFLEHLIREDVFAGRPFAVFDWHGTLYQDVLRFLAYFRPRLRRFILINPSDRIRRLLHVAQLDTLFPTYDSLDAALAAEP